MDGSLLFVGFLFIIVVCKVASAIYAHQEAQKQREADHQLMMQNPAAWAAKQELALREKAMQMEKEERAKDRKHNTAMNGARIGAWIWRNWR